MTAQVDFIVVSEFIRPLRVLFGEIGEQQEAVYCKHLRKFSQAQLNAGVEFLETHHRYKRFPQLAECIEACERNDKALASGIVDHQAAYPWIVKGQKAQKLLDEFMRWFHSSSPIVSRASREFWENELILHVRNCAWVQAQILAEVVNKGFKSADSFLETEDECRAFIREQHALCKGGSIEVPIDEQIIEKMKIRAQAMRSTSNAGNAAGGMYP